MIRGRVVSEGFATWWRFRQHVLEHRPRLAVVIGLGLVAVGLELLRPWPIQWIFDNALSPVGEPTREPLFYVWTGAVGLVAIVLVRSLAEYVATLQTTRVSHSTTRSLRNAIFGHLCQLPPRFHARHKSGDLLVRLMGDVPILRTMLVDSSVALVTRSLLIVGTVVVMLAVQPVLTLIVLALLPLVLVAVRAIGRRLTVAVHKQRRKEGAMADYLHEAIAATALIQSLGRSDDTARRFARNNRTAARAEMKAARLGARMSLSVESMLGLAFAVGLGLGSWRVLRDPTAFSAGELLVFLSYIRSLLKPIRAAARHADKIAKGTACGQRILRVLDEPLDLVDVPDAQDAPARPTRLAFQGVHYRYPDGAEALQGIDLEFRCGELTALFGRSGAGKSTLAKLAIRLFDPDRGRVLLDGLDVRGLRLQSLRDRFGLSLQETILFGDSLRENLLLGAPEAGDAELQAACHRAGADEFVARLPDGLDTVLGAGGVGLSGGQQRRICLARTLLRDSPVVLVDEPFAGLDRVAAERVRRTLAELAADRIVIVITHEREHLADFDRLVFLRGGRVEAQGPHAELLARSAAYREIVRGEAVTSP